MNIQDEIFEDFLNDLKENSDFSEVLINKLKQFWQTGEMRTRESILRIIEELIKNS